MGDGPLYSLLGGVALALIGYLGVRSTNRTQAHIATLQDKRAELEDLDEARDRLLNLQERTLAALERRVADVEAERDHLRLENELLRVQTQELAAKVAAYEGRPTRRSDP